MRPLILLSALTLTACGGGGLARGDDAPSCASVAAKQRVVEKTEKEYEEIRARTVGSPTEKNQRKLAGIAAEAAAATAALEAAQADQAAGSCPQD